MTRRALFSLAAVPAFAGKTKNEVAAVTDIDKLNGFAVEYNSYVKSMQGGVVDIRLWKKVTAAWGRMVG